MRKDSRQFVAEELQELQRTLGWMDLVIGSIDDAVCVTDQAGKLIFANEHFAYLIDTPRVFLLGQKMKDVLDLKEIENPLSEYRNIQNKLSGPAKTDSGIYKWKDKRGRKETFRVATRLLPNSDQSVFLIQNITREYELTLMKNNFIDLASHQLRTPMTAIMTYSHMLSSGFAGKLDESQQEYADTIVHSSERMIRLVDDLLKITRVQGDMQEFNTECISIAELLKRVKTEVQPQLNQKSIIYSAKIPAGTPVIHNDASAVHEILSNLVVNAVQYTREKGKIRIDIRAKNARLYIAITDTGIGIPKKHQHLLFNQFSRADNALKEYSEGTGLGLYLVKILLEKIDGSISYTTKLNAGTTFTVSLPIGSNRNAGSARQLPAAT